MDDQNQPQNSEPAESSSLENAETVVSEQPQAVSVDKPTQQSANTEQSLSESLDGNSQNNNAPIQPQPPKPRQPLFVKFKSIIMGVNIYLLLLVLILVIVGVVSFVLYRSSKKADQQNTLSTQDLSLEDLQNLKNNETTVGDTTQTLTVASNAIFNGRVLVKDNLDVAGTVQIGESLNIPGLTVAGTASIDNLQVGQNLSVAGSLAVQNTLSIQNNLSVGGSATFAGAISAPSLSIDQLVLNGDIQLNRHIDAGGTTPSVSRGGAVGGSGTVSINGTDTAGTVNINFGTGLAAGTLATINFASSFSQTPHVVITPIGSACAQLDTYVNRTTTSFTIGTINAGNAGTSCAFDYIVID